MEKSSRGLVSFLYGYIVCIVAIIVTLISLSMLVNALFSLHDPLRSTSYYVGSFTDVSSFESYKINVLTGRAPVALDGKTTAQQYTPSDADLHTAYESAKNDKIASVTLEAERRLTVALLLIIVSKVLFWFHWRWLGRMRDM